MTTSQSPRQQNPPARGRGLTPDHRPAPAHPSSTARALALPAVLAAVVTSFGLLTAHPVVRLSFFVGGGVLLAWCAALYLAARRSGRALRIDVSVRAQHWVQACAQGSVILWWAYNTPFIYAFYPFIAAELIFAYAFDSLLSWSRRDVYTLGFGPFPVIFSISLFLLFRPDWFYWQLVLVALGFAAKELIKWNKEGRRVHIFNPSSFPLAVFSLGLLLTGTTDISFGPVIANTIFDTPHIYLVVFLVSLPGQLLFGVARTTIAAVVTMMTIGLLYHAATGTYLFYDAFIPPAVFIGMHLLVTDPSTSPRTTAGRIMFGALYAMATTVLYVVLERAGAPTFYDKLLPIPLLNLSIQLIDRFARARGWSRLAPASSTPTPASVRNNLLITSTWATVFVVLFATGGVGDTHPGQYLPFWQRACSAGSGRACAYAARLTVVYCQRGSGWACNAVGLLDRRRGRPADAQFRRACDLGFAPGCENLTHPMADVASLASDHPAPRDLPIILAGTKPTLREHDPSRLAALACEQKWPGACEGWGAPARP